MNNTSLFVRPLCEEIGCPIPGTGDKDFNISEPRTMYWLLCYSCKERVPRDDNTDGYDHHPIGLHEASQNMAREDRKTRENFALSSLEDKLSNLTNLSRGIQGRLNIDSLRSDAEKLMSTTEDTIRELTPIVHNQELHTFNVENVGTIQMGKGVQEFSDKVQLLANDHSVVSVVEFQPNVAEALKPRDGNSSLSRIVAVTIFDDNLSQNESRPALQKPVTIKFKHGSQIGIPAIALTTVPPSAIKVQCVYWDFSISNWSTNGCDPR